MSSNNPVVHTKEVKTPRTTSPQWYQERSLKQSYNSKELITLNNMPSNIYLQSLKKNPTIDIRWRPRPEEEPIMLFESFPKPLAGAFSGVCRTAKGNSIVLTGSSQDRLRQIFLYMLECTRGRGCPALPVPEKLRYCTYTTNQVAARLLDMPLLFNEYEARRKIIENNQVHSEDVRIIYNDPNSKDDPIRSTVAHSIARRLFTKTLQAYPRYLELRKALPEFDEDLKRILKKLHRPEREEQARIRKEKERQIEQADRVHRGSTARGVLARRVGAVLVQTSLGNVWAAVPKEKRTHPVNSNKAAVKRENVCPQDVSKSWADQVSEEQSG